MATTSVKYEYKVHHFSFAEETGKAVVTAQHSGEEVPCYHEMFEKILNEFGEKGWEFISLHGNWFVFRRPK